MFTLTCQEVLHNVVEDHLDCGNVLGHAIEWQRPVWQDLDRTSRSYDFVDSFFYRHLSRTHDAVVRDHSDPGLDLWIPFLTEMRRAGRAR